MLGQYSHLFSFTLNLDFMRPTELQLPEFVQRFCESSSDAEKRSAFRLLYDHAQHLVFATAVRIAPNATLAEDLSQEIWLKILRSVCSYRAEASFGAWLRRVALRTWLDMRKTSSERTQRELVSVSLSESIIRSGAEDILMSDGQAEANPDALAEADDVQILIEKALQRLTKAEENVFRARHFGDLSFADIAAEFGVSEGTVKTLHFRAMKKLQSLLKPIFETSSPLS